MMSKTPEERAITSQVAAKKNWKAGPSRRMEGYK